MKIEKKKLKNALNEYQQFKREEQERIEQAQRKRQDFWNGLLAVATIIGIIAVIYYGWRFALGFVLYALFFAVDLVLRCFMVIFSFMFYILIALVVIAMLPEKVRNIVFLLMISMVLLLIIMSYIPSSDFYFQPLWTR